MTADRGSYKYRPGDCATWIPKAELEDGAWYFGKCRNSDTAQWKDGKFRYLRTKFGSTYWDDVECPEDDRGFDLFFAERKTEKPTDERHQTFFAKWKLEESTDE